MTYTCPECRAGKHANCHGDAWNNETDKPVECTCWAWKHEPPQEPAS